MLSVKQPYRSFTIEISVGRVEHPTAAVLCVTCPEVKGLGEEEGL
jgi:hypothetical protein